MAAIAVLICAVVATPAQAAWSTGASLVTGSLAGGLQAPAGSASNAVDISDDGRFAVFYSTAGNLLPADAPSGGIFRKDLRSDSAPLRLVAKRLGSATNQCGVDGIASISANGRFVVFASGENSLVPGDTNNRRDVFVRDMSKTIGEAGAFELASAVNGGSAGAAYSLPTMPPSGTPIVEAGEECLWGSELPPKTDAAISDDGTKVIFTNMAFTNLGAVSGNTTAPNQLYVRDLAANTTELVTRIAYDRPSPNPEKEVGAVGDPLPYLLEFDSSLSLKDGRPLASISGDGTTVVWEGMWGRAQADLHARLLDGDESDIGSLGGMVLWRRIADGLAAKTRWVAAIDDLDNPTCDLNTAVQIFEVGFPEEDMTPEEQACLGPFISLFGIVPTLQFLIPRISDDGNTIAFISDRRFRSDTGTAISTRDAFVSDMSPGVNRRIGTKRLTRWTGTVPSDPGARPINDISLSGDGNRVALLTSRIDFGGVPTLTQTGTFPPSSPSSRDRVMMIDKAGTGSLTTGTVEWVTRPASGDLTTEVVSGFTLDSDGDTLLFATQATNLYTGANGATQVLCVKRSGECVTDLPVDATAPVVTISAPINGSSTSAAAVNLTYTATDNSGATPVCDKASGSSQPLALGVNELSVTCTDASDNSSTATVSITRITSTDTTPPVVVITAPVNGSTTTAAAVTLTYTATDDSGVAPSCNKVNGSSQPLVLGANTISLTCTDGSTNSTTATVSVTRTNPVTPPTPPVQPGPIVNSLRLLPSKITGESAAIPAEVSGAGSLTAAGTAKLPKGKKLKVQKAGSAAATANAATTLAITFKLNSAAKKYLKKKKKLVVKVTITFQPASGAAITQTTNLTFKAKKKKKK
ncbi:MAG: hypothetical protein WAP35_08615 [Solirubrobacterales bacterium]